MAFEQALRAGRVYSGNNEMYRLKFDQSVETLAAVFSSIELFSISIREDRLLFADEVVFRGEAGAESLPFLLYRNAIRSLTFQNGFSEEEHGKLIEALNTDFGPIDLTGEDLLTTLWRLQLPNLRYVAIDTLTSGPAISGAASMSSELDVIQSGIDRIVAKLYQSDAPDEDIVAGVSIGRQDLEALPEIRSCSDEDWARLDHWTERVVHPISTGALDTMRGELDRDTHDSLTRRMLSLLVELIVREDTAENAESIIELLQQLYDTLLLEGRFDDAQTLLRQLQIMAEDPSGMKELHLSQQLLSLFSTEGRVLPILERLHDLSSVGKLSRLQSFLLACGRSIVPALLASLKHLELVGHRRFVCGVIAELGVPEPAVLSRAVREEPEFVVRDILELSMQLEVHRRAPVIEAILQHEDPSLRAAAAGRLAEYGRGAADARLAKLLCDEDEEVRIIAARQCALRQVADILPALQERMDQSILIGLEPKELKVLFSAYALVGGTESVSTLRELLAPTFRGHFGSLKIQLAAASSLGLLVHLPEAKDALRQGSNQRLRPKLREACSRALRQGDEFDQEDALASEPRRRRRRLFGPNYEPHLAVRRQPSTGVRTMDAPQTESDRAAHSSPLHSSPLGSAQVSFHARNDQAPDTMELELNQEDLEIKFERPEFLDAHEEKTELIPSLGQAEP